MRHGVVVLVVVASSGCIGSYTEAQLAARERFSRQYNCPEDRVRVENIGGGAVRTAGCRREVIFQCDDSPSMWDTARCVPESSRLVPAPGGR